MHFRAQVPTVSDFQLSSFCCFLSFVSPGWPPKAVILFVSVSTLPREKKSRVKGLVLCELVETSSSSSITRTHVHETDYTA